MKKIFFTLAFIAISQIGLAQDDSFKTDALKIISMSGSDVSIKLAKNQILKMIPEAKQAGFLIEFDASLPALYEKMAKVYMETYTAAEIKAMIQFYQTPVGLKMTAKSGEVAEKSQTAGKEWGESLQAMVMKYMQ